ncbi:HpcH/HpaI aldolase/citrate lyase family protein [Salipiger mangrovisoli]|uniref:CoA ester lyase n=1 Tax=Salipiger mangrovisoli TaxID=2865933 RepID=A0ABR9X7U3_9RHOB|nr:CoA ester lyase [Salipiger mangrovisoli]MBE9639569.1 CoA ester lyase [Salipiger mangrovisoli]
MKLRSLLYVPANAERFVAKAHERGADAVILDLEDAVEEGSKDAARAALAAAVPHVGQGGAKVYVRVNTGPRMGADARAALAAGAHGIMLPKAETAASIDALLAELGAADDGTADILAIIEDAAGVLDARQVAAHPRVVALALGAEDFATSTGGQPIPEVLRLPKLMVHYAAKAEGKLSLGLLRSVADFNDAEGLAAAAAEAARFGFDGASCIHPKVVSVLNTAFSPSEAALTRARRIVEAAEKAAAQGTGAFMLDGEFVDLPVLNRAKAVLAKAGATA